MGGTTVLMWVQIWFERRVVSLDKTPLAHAVYCLQKYKNEKKKGKKEKINMCLCSLRLRTYLRRAEKCV